MNAYLYDPHKPLPLGITVKPYGRIQMVGMTGGERYYWLVDDDGSVAMMPAALIEKIANES